ncbi:MAG: YjfB family protein [Ruminiclostridium sp.]
MGGITSYIAQLSTSMAQYSVQQQASVSMLKNTMDSQEAASAQLIESLSESVPSADGRGVLLDVRA